MCLSSFSTCLVVIILKGNRWIQRMDDLQALDVVSKSRLMDSWFREVYRWAWFVVAVLRVVLALSGFVGVNRTIGGKKGSWVI